MQTNEFEITQHGDEDFTIKRLYYVQEEGFFTLFKRHKVLLPNWRVIQDYEKSGSYYYPPRRWKSLEEAKAYIDKTLKDEATYPIKTRHP